MIEMDADERKISIFTEKEVDEGKYTVTLIGAIDYGRTI